jgi:hypothetical protein
MKPSNYDPFDHFPIVIRFELSHFKRLIEVNAASLEEHLHRLLAYAEQYPEEDREEMFLDEVMSLRDVLPGLSYGAVFIALFGYLEHMAREMCYWHPGRKPKSSLRNARLHTVLNCLRDSPFGRSSKSFFDAMNLLHAIRNAIAHNNGHLSNEKTELFHRWKAQPVFRNLEPPDAYKRLIITREFLDDFLSWTDENLHKMTKGLSG